MASFIGKLRAKTHDWLEGQKQKGTEDRARAAKRKLERREASGYYVLEWGLPSGVQKRSLSSEFGLGLLRKALTSLGATDFKVSPVVLKKANKQKGTPAHMRYDCSWRWEKTKGSMIITNEVSLFIQKKKLNMVGATDVTSVFKRPTDGARAKARPARSGHRQVKPRLTR